MLSLMAAGPAIVLLDPALQERPAATALANQVEEVAGDRHLASPPGLRQLESKR